MRTDGSYKWRERQREKIQRGILHINIFPRIIHSSMKIIIKKRENWINLLAELSAVSSEEVVIGESFDFRRFVISNQWNKFQGFYLGKKYFGDLNVYVVLK